MLDSLKYFREQNNYSQEAVASFLGVSRQMYIKYENGEVEPPLKVVVQLAHFYRVSYDVLIDNKIPEKRVTYDNSKKSTSKYSYNNDESYDTSDLDERDDDFYGYDDEDYTPELSENDVYDEESGVIISYDDDYNSPGDAIQSEYKMKEKKNWLSGFFGKKH